MTIDTRRIPARRIEPGDHPAVQAYLDRAAELEDEGDGQTHWKCPDLCGASCACTGPARRMAHRACGRSANPTDWLGREETR